MRWQLVPLGLLMAMVVGFSTLVVPVWFTAIVATIFSAMFAIWWFKGADL